MFCSLKLDDASYTQHHRLIRCNGGEASDGRFGEVEVG